MSPSTIESASHAPIRLLLVEDNPAEARLLQLILAETENRFRVVHAECLDDALKQLRGEPFGAILLDLSLPDSRGIDTLERVLGAAPRVPILVLTGLNDQLLATEAIRKGAQDYLVKGDVNGFLMVRAIRYALERKRTEEALKEADRRKDEFLANISHELRTPMNAILGMTELALGEPISPVVREYLETARSSARVLLTLLNEILDFSRIEAGKFEFRPTPFRLRAVLDETMKVVAIRAHEKGLELVCDLPLDLPDGLYGDPLRLQQVLVNLVGNAVKFTEHGEIVVRVRQRDGGEERMGETAQRGFVVGKGGLPRQRREEAGLIPPSVDALAPAETIQLEFSVSDTGIGISLEDQQRIFAPFTQADASPTRPHGGTGLGLAIATSLAAMMQGAIRLESELGQGSTFYFTVRFPRRPEFDLPPNWRYAPESLRGMRVLVADHSEVNRQMLVGFLKSWGMEAESVGDGQAVHSCMAEVAQSGRQYGMLILEASLPKLDCFAMAKTIQGSTAPAPVVLLMVTSADRSSHAGRGKRAASTMRLEKPVSQIELFRAILRVTGSGDDHGSPGHVAPDETLPAEAASRKLRILLAEDTRANRLVVVRMLGKRGHSVQEVVDGQEALEWAGRERFDLILMDLQMPVMDGFQATAAIRALSDPVKAHVPIVALTAHAMKGDAERCLAAGMDAYLSKPIDGRALIELAERLAQKVQSDA